MNIENERDARLAGVLGAWAPSDAGSHFAARANIARIVFRDKADFHYFFAGSLGEEPFGTLTFAHRMKLWDVPEAVWHDFVRVSAFACPDHAWLAVFIRHRIPLIGGTEGMTP
jgi:hypothetical protein